jgi:polar amino acid transport system substrate-binding protein
MRQSFLPLIGGLIMGISIMVGSARADGLKDEIAPTGKLRVAIGISAAGGAYWSIKTEKGYAGVPVDLGKALADQLGLPIEYVTYPNSGKITDAGAKGEWDVSFLPEDPERAKKIAFGPIYEVSEATYIVKAGSTIKDFAALDQPGVKVAAVNDTTTMRGAMAHLKKAKVTGYQTFDEILALLKAGDIDAFALSRDQLTALSKKIPGTRVLDETFKQTFTSVAVPLNHPLSLEYASKFMAEAKTSGLLRKAFDNNGLKDTPLRAK